MLSEPELSPGGYGRRCQWQLGACHGQSGDQGQHVRCQIRKPDPPSEPETETGSGSERAHTKHWKKRQESVSHQSVRLIFM